MQLEHGRSLFKALSLNEKVVLDAGCGDGRATMDFVQGQSLSGLYAFDVSASQIESANKLKGDNKPGFTFFVAGFDNFLDVQVGGVVSTIEGKVDVALSNFALHLAPSREAAFKNIYASLKPGGEFHAVYPTHCSFLSRALREAEQDERFAEFVSKKPIHEKNPNGVLLGNEETEQYPTHLICTYKLLLSAGFSLNSLRVTERVGLTYFETAEDVVRFVAGINMHRCLVPEELRADFDEFMAFEIRKTPYFIGPDRLILATPAIELHAYKEKEKIVKLPHVDSFVE